MKKIIAAITLAFTISVSMGNNIENTEKRADSLWQIWNAPESDSASKVKALIKLTDVLMYSNLDSAFKIFHLIDNYGIPKKQPLLTANYLHQGSILFQFKGYLDSAIYQYQLCYEVYRQGADSLNMYGTLLNIGALYSTLKDTFNAHEYYKKVLKFTKGKPDLRTLTLRVTTLSNMVDITSNLQQKEKYARSAYHGAKVLFKEPSWYNANILTSVLNNLGSTLNQMNHNDSAYLYYNKSLDISNSYAIDTRKIESLWSISEIWFDKKNYERALDFTLQAYNQAQQLNDYITLKSVYTMFNEIYEQLGDYEKSLYYFKEYINLKDSIENKEQEREVYNLELAFQKKESEYKLAENKQMAATKRFKERFTFTGITIIIIIITIFTFIRRNIIIKKERAELLLELNNKKLKTFVTDIVTTSEIPELTMKKIQLAAENKLNKTDIKILNILLEEPLISNKEIADKISLSLEGTSSSLRKMYRLFDIKENSNKKIALLKTVMEIGS